MTSSLPILTVQMMSWGLKSGPLPKADLYLDCRCIENPYHIPGLVGDDSRLTTWMYDTNLDMIEAMTDIVTKAIKTLPGRRHNEDPNLRPMVVCFFCAYGKHRSVIMKQIVANEIKIILSHLNLFVEVL